MLLVVSGRERTFHRSPPVAKNTLRRWTSVAGGLVGNGQLKVGAVVHGPVPSGAFNVATESTMLVTLAPAVARERSSKMTSKVYWSPSVGRVMPSGTMPPKTGW